MLVKWLGPPEHSAFIPGVGIVSPGEIVHVSRPVADRLIRDGRAAAVVAPAKPKKNGEPIA